MKLNVRRFLDSLRGGKHICGCGRVLSPIYLKGKRIGVTHKNPEDDDHHLEFFSGIRIGRIAEEETRDDLAERN